MYQLTPTAMETMVVTGERKNIFLRLTRTYRFGIFRNQLLIFALLIALKSLAQESCFRNEVNTATVRGGKWSTASNWSKGVPAPGSVVSVNHAMEMDMHLLVQGGRYTINNFVTDKPGNGLYNLTVEKHSNDAGIIDIKASTVFEGKCSVEQGASLIVRKGNTLQVGSADFDNSSEVVVEEGATFIISTDFVNENNCRLTINGTLVIKGNFTGRNNAEVSGSGKITTTGCITFKNHASAFGCTLNCATGPCSTEQLCSGNSNTIGASQTICPGGPPAMLTGNDSGKDATYQWMYSTTSETEGYIIAPGQSKKQNYSPGPLTTTTWYVRKASTGCYSRTSAPVKITVVNVWKGTTSPDWHTASNWCAGVPVASNDILIPANAPNMPQITHSTGYGHTIEIQPGAMLSVSTAALEVSGDWNNNGNFTAGEESTVLLKGTENQNVSGRNEFYNLTVNKSTGSATITPGTDHVQRVRKNLSLISGNIITNNNLTVDVGTGQIAPAGNGNLTGNLTLEKYFNEYGYNYIACPLTGVTVADINDDVSTSSNLYIYDETDPAPDVSSGWSYVGDLSMNIGAPNQGFALGIYSPATIRFTGGFDHNKNFEYMLSYTNSGDTSSDGWHLIGNPYPATLDWYDTCIFKKTNIYDDMYLYSSDQGSYETRYIAPMQAFWVQSKKGGGKLVINPKGICNNSEGISVGRIAANNMAGNSIESADDAGMVTVTLKGNTLDVAFADVHAPTASISLYTYSGKEIYKSGAADIGSGNFTYDMSEADPGMYILNIVTDNKLTSKKFAVQR